MKKSSKRRIERNRQCQISKRQLRFLAAKLGVSAALGRVRPELVAAALQYQASLPTVTFSPLAAADPDRKKIGQAVERAIGTATLKLPGSLRITAWEFFGPLRILGLIAANIQQKDECRRQWAVDFKKRIEEVNAAGWENSGDWLCNAIADGVALYTRFDRKILSFDLEIRKNPGHLRQISLRVFRAPARDIQMNIDGEKRRAYQVGLTSFDERDGDWIYQSAQSYGLSDSLDPLPVYMQGHAIRRFFERTRFDNETFDPWLWLHVSLKHPAIIERGSDGPLIEFRVGSYLLGYFVPTLEENGILIRTFLFAVMAGTPEHRRLQDVLRLRSHGITVMQLDRIESFAMSDLTTDPELQQLIAEAGLGSLLEFADLLKVGGVYQQLKVAGTVRRYIGRPPLAARVGQEDPESIETGGSR